MALATLPKPVAVRSRFKTILWVSLGLITLFVFITSEVMLVTDYPMYHKYRLQVIADRGLLIPHTLAGTFALLAGPLQFSTRFRQPHPEPCAGVLEPSGRCAVCGRCDRVYARVDCHCGHWAELA